MEKVSNKIIVGTYTSSVGEKYVGDWKEGKMDGNGIGILMHRNILL